MMNEENVDQESEEEFNGEEKRKQEKKRLYDKERFAKLSQEQRDRRRELERKRWANATPEERAKKAEGKRKRRQQLSKDPEYQCRRELEKIQRRQDELRAKEREENEKLLEPQQAKAVEQIGAGVPPEVPRIRRDAPLGETPEQREKRLEAKRLAQRARRAQMTDEERREFRLRRYFQKKAREENMSKEEREASLKKMAEHVKNYLKNLPPEKKAGYKEKQKERMKNQMKKMWKEQPEKMRNYTRERIAKETPQQRQVRLRRYQIYAARRKLKKQLEDEGVLSVEDIDKRCEELGEKMKSEPLPPPSSEALSEYKPRPSGRKPKKMRVKPSGRKPQNVDGRPRNNWNKEKASSEYTYKPMLSKRKPRNRGILYELEMERKAAQLNSQSGITTENEISFCSSPQQQQNKNNPLSSSTGTDAEQGPMSETLDDCPSSPVDDDHFDPNVEEDDYHEDNHKSQQPENIVAPSPPLPANCCPNCPLSFQTESELSRHINTEHPWKCPVCSERVSNSSQLASHFNKKHSKDDNFVCMRCPWKQDNLSGNSCFSRHKDLLDHVQHHHTSSYWPCPACNLLLYSESRFNSHFACCPTARALRLKQTEKVPFLCGICGKSFSKKGFYQTHVNRYHHPDKEKLVCPCCGRLCSYTISFWNHFVSCAQLMPSELEKNVNQPSKFNLSEMRETKRLQKKPSAGPIPCEQCGKTFAQKCTLDDHIRRDHQGESYMCPQCARNFQSAGKLWRHQAQVHGLDDLPPPPGVEVMRCLYCQDFIMRGYEFHVKKKHPEHLQQFRENELPKIKEKLEQVRYNNPKRPYSNNASGNAYSNNWKEIAAKYGQVKELDGQDSKNKKVYCPVCKVVISQKHLGYHLKRRHEHYPKIHEPVQCSLCESTLVNVTQLRCHYAEKHALEGFEKKLLLKNLITTRCAENVRRQEAVCSTCNAVLTMDRLSVRVHFLACHYKQFLEVAELAGVGSSAV